MIGVPVPAAISRVATNYAATNLADSGPANTIFSVGHGEAFVFSPNLGQAATAKRRPHNGPYPFSKANFEDINALLAATRNDDHSNAVITEAANDTLTIEHVTAAQVHAHHNNFHII